MNAMQLGMQLFQEIEAERTSGNWRWEKRISGPLSWGDVSTITRMAGCWCDSPSANEGESVRFYANQNHPDHGGRP
jgi:hypothetical protein